MDWTWGLREGGEVRDPPLLGWSSCGTVMVSGCPGGWASSHLRMPIRYQVENFLCALVHSSTPYFFSFGGAVIFYFLALFPSVDSEVIYYSVSCVINHPCRDSSSGCSGLVGHCLLRLAPSGVLLFLMIY